MINVLLSYIHTAKEMTFDDPPENKKAAAVESSGGEKKR